MNENKYMAKKARSITKSEGQLKDCLIGDDRDRRGDRYYRNNTRTFPKY